MDLREQALADACMGLGWPLGRLSEAHGVTLKSLTLLQKLGERNRVLVLQNLATIAGDLGLWNVALPKFDTCRAAYQVFGWPAAEASLVEELALLERQDEPILRGRVLQLLGEVRLGQAMPARVRSCSRRAAAFCAILAMMGAKRCT